MPALAALAFLGARAERLVRLFTDQGFQAGASDANTGAGGGPGSIPGSGRPLGEGQGNALQYSRLGSPRDGGVWQATSPASPTRLPCVLLHYLNAVEKWG